MRVASGLSAENVDLENDGDWTEAFACAAAPMCCEGAACSRDPIDLVDVIEALYAREGENDGQSWILIGRVRDGRFFFLTAWCDYTGWDCQAGGQVWVSHSLDNLIQFGIDADARAEWSL